MDYNDSNAGEELSKNKDIIDELELMVTELKTSNTNEAFFNQLININQKIDLIRKAVENLCVTTKSCLNSTDNKNDC